MMNEIAAINMIKQQLRTNEVYDEAVIDLYTKIPRHEFLPQKMKEYAYADLRIPLPHNQQMLCPQEEARLLQSLQLSGKETVLEIGTGTGFFTSLLASLAKKVITIDFFSDFTLSAQTKLTTMGFKNIEFITGNAASGWLEKAPYDVIVFTGAISAISETIKLQVLPGGKLFVIVGKKPIMNGKLLRLDHDGYWHDSLLFETYTPLLINKLKQEKFNF